MSRTPARITQADVSRAIRAAQKAGASAVEIKPDGGILIRLVPTSTELTEAPVEPTKEIVL